MKRAITIGLFLAGVATIGLGQVNATFGNPVEIKKGANFLLSGHTEQTFLVSSGSVFSKTSLYSFGQKDLNMRESIDLSKDAPANVNDLTTHVVNIGAQPIVLIEDYHARKYKKEIYATSCSPDGKPGSYVKLLEEANVLAMPTIIRTDSNQLCIIVLLQKTDSSEGKLNVYLFNKELKIIGKSSINLPVSNKKYNYEEAILTPDNCLLLPVYVAIDPPILVDKTPIVTPSIMEINIKTAKVSEYKIDVPGKVIWDLDFGIDARGKVLAMGFYGVVEEKKKRVQGLYCCIIDREKKTIISTRAREMPGEVAALMNADADMDGSDLFTFGAPMRSYKFGDILMGGGFHIREIIGRENDNKVILAERSALAIHALSNPAALAPGASVGATSAAYYTVGALAISINALGDIAWIKLLPVKQRDDRLVVEHGTSYVSAYTSEKVFVLFNDSKKNREKNVTEFNDAKTNTDPEHGIPTIAEITEKGEVNIKKAFEENIEGNEYLMVTSQYLRMKPDELIISLMGKRTFRLGRLSFK